MTSTGTVTSGPPLKTLPMGVGRVPRRVVKSTLPILLPSLVRRALLCYLILGVPTLLALSLTATVDAIPAILITLSATLLISSLAGWPWLLGDTLYRRFFGLFIILAASTIVVAASREQMVALMSCFVWASIFISVPFLLANGRDVHLARRAIGVAGICVTGSLIGAYVGLEYFGVVLGEVLIEEGAVRSFGPFGDQVGFVIIYFAFLEMARHRPIPAVFHIGAVLFTGTRGASLALVVGALWLAWLQLGVRTQRAKNVSRSVRSAAVVLVGAIIFLASPYGSTTLARLGDIAWGQGSLGQRAAAMRIGVNVIVDNPVAGVGYLGFSRQGERYQFDKVSEFGGQERSTYTAQNQFIQTGTDAGIPGLTLLFLFFWSLHRILHQHVSGSGGISRSYAQACSSWVVALAIGNQGAVWLLPTAITPYLFLLTCAVEVRALALESDRRFTLSRMHAR